MLNKEGKRGRASGRGDPLKYDWTAIEQTLKKRLVTDIEIKDILKNYII